MYMQSSSHAYASSEEPGYFPCTIYETRLFNPLHLTAAKCTRKISCPLHPTAANVHFTSAVFCDRCAFLDLGLVSTCNRKSIEA